MVKVLVCSVTMVAASSARADLGFQFDATTLAFEYNRAPGPDGLVGQINITDGVSSSLTVGAYDLGADRVFGGGDDQLVDLAKINSAASFDTSFSANVFRLGSGSYYIEGTILATDATGVTVMQGGFTSSYIVAGGGMLFLEGDLSNPGGVLSGTTLDSWVFNGVAEDTADDILAIGDYGRNGVDGTVRLDSGRLGYTGGSVVCFQFTGYFGDIDGFFLDSDRFSNNSDMKVRLVPAPGAVGLAATGLALIGWRKWRSTCQSK